MGQGQAEIAVQLLQECARNGKSPAHKLITNQIELFFSFAS